MTRAQQFGAPEYWIKSAEGDLAMARAKVRGAMVEHHCFHAQQAAEKALKAVFVAHGIPFKFTHSINVLLRDLRRHGVAFPAEIGAARDLSVYAVETRYAAIEELPESRLKDAIKAARVALKWAKKEIARVQARDN